MAIYKHNNGNWYCRGRVNGERYHLPCTGATTKEQAKAIDDSIRFKIRQRQNGLIADEKTYTFGFMMDNFVKVSKANNKWVKGAETKAKYLCKYFGRQKNIKCIKPSDIEKFKLYMKEQGKANATINRYLAAIKRAYNLLIYDDLIVYTPMKKIEPLTENNKRYRFLTKTEWKRLKLAMSELLFNIVKTALLTGFRLDNVLGLRWEQIIFELSVIEILKQNNKGKKVIRHPMSDMLVKHLQSLGPESGYVFVNPDTGTRFKDIRKSFKSALERANIKDFKFHDLRRTFGTWLRQSGIDIRTIQFLLDHSSVAVTERYLAVPKEEYKKAVCKIDKFMI